MGNSGLELNLAMMLLTLVAYLSTIFSVSMAVVVSLKATIITTTILQNCTAAVAIRVTRSTKPI